MDPIVIEVWSVGHFVFLVGVVVVARWCARYIRWAWRYIREKPTKCDRCWGTGMLQAYTNGPEGGVTDTADCGVCHGTGEKNG